MQSNIDISGLTESPSIQLISLPSWLFSWKIKTFSQSHSSCWLVGDKGVPEEGGYVEETVSKETEQVKGVYAIFFPFTSHV